MMARNKFTYTRVNLQNLLTCNKSENKSFLHSIIKGFDAYTNNRNTYIQIRLKTE